ncbi:MAG: hypothetical protein PWQ09_1219 [Candidatus Cloacimonadota bacterium]|jgi:CDP-glycerol glycerophosphotransferase (TagB/SpsB family)|nr:hypothetical protein [Candidatus Cloacimonadota bacterium]
MGRNNKQIYYYANQVYQFSHSIPLYQKIGGKFILRKKKRYLPFIFYMRNTCLPKEPCSILNAPAAIVKKCDKLEDISGIFISLSNVKFKVGKGSKTIFLGHGTGDKKYGRKSVNLDKYDYIFLTGEKHLAKIQDVGLKIPSKKLIKIGNLRFDDYINDKFTKQELLKKRKIKNVSKPIILYAPTWKWGNGTLLKYFFKFAKEITKEYNLIVRPHNFDAGKLPFLKIWAELHNIHDIYFSNPRNLRDNDTFHDFKLSDLMISDTSSVLYEYLITRKPIIVAETKPADLHNMPDNMNIMNKVDIYDSSDNIVKLIYKNLNDKFLPEKLNELLHNCFYFNDGKATERAAEFIRQL